jgi:hypothetical protein
MKCLWGVPAMVGTDSLEDAPHVCGNKTGFILSSRKHPTDNFHQPVSMHDGSNGLVCL